MPADLLMDYNTAQFIAQKILKYEAGDTTFTDMLPHMIGYAEKRIYVDFDFLCTLASQNTTLTSNTREVVLQTNIIVPQSLNVITPVSTTNPDAGTRNPLTRVGIDYMNAVYTSATNAALPQYWALIGNPTIGTNTTAGAYNVLLGPFPDQAYTLETIGTVRPTPLSPTNPTTFISTYCPDLFVAAMMVFGFGYQSDFGGQASDPGTAMSWNAQYEAIKQR